MKRPRFGFWICCVMLAKTLSFLAPHNPLDSTSPMMKKGKQREVPKAKKPTPLKKVCGILFEIGRK